MKVIRLLSVFPVAAALCGAALECSAQLTQPYTNTFDTSTSVVGWFYQYGSILSSWATMAWDPTMDAATNANSGSVKFSIPWTSSGQYQYCYGYLNMDGPVTERVITMPEVS